MTRKVKVRLQFGALADPLDEQLERQGVIMDCTAQQADADAISRLYVRGLLTESETDRAWKRLRRDVQTLFTARAA